MNPTLDWLHQAEEHIRHTLDELRPKLLETQGKIEHRLKDDKSAVTQMDLHVEERLREALHRFEPSVGFGGEETGVDYNQKTFWLVDPIDGTEPFIRGLPFATNMIALIDNGAPVMGVIYNFALGDYYLAIKGQGATKNGHAIRASQRPMERAFISLGRTGLRPKTRALGDRLRDKFGTGCNTVNVGAAGYILAAVAEGAVEARVAMPSVSKPWDFAPGALLVHEAGGHVVNIGSDNYDYLATDIIAAGPGVFQDLQAFINENVLPL